MNEKIKQIENLIDSTENVIIGMKKLKGKIPSGIRGWIPRLVLGYGIKRLEHSTKTLYTKLSEEMGTRK